jgi:hypothetical protein
MPKPRRFPSVKTESDPITYDPVLVVQWTEDAEPQRFCDHSWCTGKCGLPALVMPPTTAAVSLRERKAYSSMVACGAMMQAWRVEWTGEKVEVPEEHRADIAERMWW